VDSAQLQSKVVLFVWIGRACFSLRLMEPGGRASVQVLGRELQSIMLHRIGYAELVHIGLFPGGR
jgi:hypothetical protein